MLSSIWAHSSLMPSGAAALKPITSRPMRENNVIGMASTAATRKRLRMSRAISAIDIPAWPA